MADNRVYLYHPPSRAVVFLARRLGGPLGYELDLSRALNRFTEWLWCEHYETQEELRIVHESPEFGGEVMPDDVIDFYDKIWPQWHAAEMKRRQEQDARRRAGWSRPQYVDRDREAEDLDNPELDAFIDEVNAASVSP